MEDKIDGVNRRKSQRKEVAFTLSYCVENPPTLRISLGVADDINALMSNLSAVGMAIVSPLDLPIDTQLHIRFNLMDLTLFGDQRIRKMVVLGEVVSKAVLPNGNYKVGIRFDNISDEDKLAINNFIKRSK